MDAVSWAGILLSVGCTSLGQLLLKLGMMEPDVQAAVNSGHVLPLTQAVIGQPQLIAGLLFYAAAAFAWMLVLARIDLSLAYPFVGLGFVLVLVLSWVWLGETPGAGRLAGSLLVVAGVLLVARAEAT
jgi:drug/metabolite transporter (DMT)-like permease